MVLRNFAEEYYIFAALPCFICRIEHIKKMIHLNDFIIKSLHFQFKSISESSFRYVFHVKRVMAECEIVAGGRGKGSRKWVDAISSRNKEIRTRHCFRFLSILFSHLLFPNICYYAIYYNRRANVDQQLCSVVKRDGQVPVRYAFRLSYDTKIGMFKKEVAASSGLCPNSFRLLCLNRAGQRMVCAVGQCV